jgi:Rieske Fe-S protein
VTTRREVVLGTIAVACGGTSGCAGVKTYRTSAPAADGRVDVPRAEFDRLALERGSIRVESPSLPEPVILIAIDGAFRAIGSTCTHQQCAVRPGGAFLRCACHGSTFDLAGEVVRGPAPAPLTRYDVAFDAETIRIATVPS